MRRKAKMDNDCIRICTASQTEPGETRTQTRTSGHLTRLNLPVSRKKETPTNSDRNNLSLTQLSGVDTPGPRFTPKNANQVHQRQTTLIVHRDSSLTTTEASLYTQPCAARRGTHGVLILPVRRVTTSTAGTYRVDHGTGRRSRDGVRVWRNPRVHVNVSGIGSESLPIVVLARSPGTTFRYSPGVGRSCRAVTTGHPPPREIRRSIDDPGRCDQSKKHGAIRSGGKRGAQA